MTDLTLELISRALRRYFVRIYAAPNLYAVVDTEKGWDAVPEFQGRTSEEAYDLAARLNARAVQAALLSGDATAEQLEAVRVASENRETEDLPVALADFRTFVGPAT